MADNSVLKGGCFCGQIRFRVDASESYACFCHCQSCQRAAGAPVVAWGTFGKDGFSVTNGSVLFRESSPGVTRGHCSDCGSCLTYEHEKRPHEIDISLNVLDEPSSIAPRSHIWVEDRQPWLDINDDLPQYPKTTSTD